jgi:hypothetical protein
MGINVNNLRFLVRAKLAGADYSRTAMLGRQGLHLSYGDFHRVLTREFRLPLSDAAVRAAYERRFAEGLLELLGAHEVHSVDYSDFEGAEFVADLNQPVPAHLHGRYTAVIDGGTLEHVFHFPNAIESAMRMVAVGGHFLGMTMANNHMGHGFYQFSPELFYRVFSPENGFEVVEMFLHEGREARRWRRALDSNAVRFRLTLRNAEPTGLLVLARKRADAPLFRSPPVQSDYAAAWSEGVPTRPRLRKRMYRSLPAPLKTLTARLLELRSKPKRFPGERPASPPPAAGAGKRDPAQG